MQARYGASRRWTEFWVFIAAVIGVLAPVAGKNSAGGHLPRQPGLLITLLTLGYLGPG
jgi:hypothetical protein